MRSKLLTGFLVIVVLLRCDFAARGQTGDTPLEAKLRKAVTRLPYFSNSDYVKKNAELNPLAGQYRVLGDGIMNYTEGDAVPPVITIGVAWVVQPSPRGRCFTTQEMERLFESARRNAPKDARLGGFGLHSYLFGQSQRGSIDLAVSGDPYFGTGEGYVVAPAGTLWLQINISVAPDAKSHPQRNRPSVRQAAQEAAVKHATNAIGNLMVELLSGCDGKDPPPPQKPIEARPEFETITLVRGKLPSTTCGIYVRNWPAGRSVSVCFPDVQDTWGSLPGGLVVTFYNTFYHVGAVVPRGEQPGEYYLPLWWYARCQAQPGVHTVTCWVQEGPSINQIGGCPESNNKARVTFRINVSDEMSGNCTPIPAAGGAGGGAGAGGGGTGAGGAGGGSRNPLVGRWRTPLGDLRITEDNPGVVRGTIGSTVVINGKVNDRGELIGDFIDKTGDGRISLISPDGKTLGGVWVRQGGPSSGGSNTFTGTRIDDKDANTPNGGGAGGANQPGGGAGGANQPGGIAPTPGAPGTTSLPPLTPFPSPTKNFALQAPELRAQPNQDLTTQLLMLNGTDVVNMNWNLKYDPAVILMTQGSQVERGNLLKGPFEVNPFRAGLVRMGFAQKEGITGSGVLAEMKFRAIGTPGKRTPLTLEATTVNNSKLDNLKPELIHGFVEIISPGQQIPGSTGGSGGGGGPGGQPGLTMRNAQDALKMSVGLIPEDLVADLDRDGQVTSRDAYLIMQRVYLYMQKGNP